MGEEETGRGCELSLPTAASDDILLGDVGRRKAGGGGRSILNQDHRTEGSACGTEIREDANRRTVGSNLCPSPKSVCAKSGKVGFRDPDVMRPGGGIQADPTLLMQVELVEGDMQYKVHGRAN